MFCAFGLLHAAHGNCWEIVYACLGKRPAKEMR